MSLDMSMPVGLMSLAMSLMSLPSSLRAARLRREADEAFHGDDERFG